MHPNTCKARPEPDVLTMSTFARTETAALVSAEYEAGTDDTRTLELSSSVVSDVKADHAFGRAPVSRFWDTSRSSSCVSTDQLEGRLPVMVLDAKDSCDTVVSCDTASGSVPVKHEKPRDSEDTTELLQDTPYQLPSHGSLLSFQDARGSVLLQPESNASCCCTVSKAWKGEGGAGGGGRYGGRGGGVGGGRGGGVGGGGGGLGGGVGGGRGGSSGGDGGGGDGGGGDGGGGLGGGGGDGQADPSAVEPAVATTLLVRLAGMAPHSCALPLSTMRVTLTRPTPQEAGMVDTSWLLSKLSVLTAVKVLYAAGSVADRALFEASNDVSAVSELHDAGSLRQRCGSNTSEAV